MANKWDIIQPSLKPITDKIQPPIDQIIGVLDLLIAALNVAQAVLNVIKVFLVGFLDPIKPLVEQIIAQIQQIINDLRQLGIYVNGDYYLFTPNNGFSDLLGGYDAYERRMLGRLLDTSDPGRPDFSGDTPVIALFLYASTGDIGKLIEIITAIMKFFGKKADNIMPYGVPVPVEVKYKAKNFLNAPIYVTEDKLTESPESISVTWTSPPVTGLPFINSPSPPSYIVHVSTIEEGFNVITTQPKDGTSAEIVNLPVITSVAIDPVTNKPLVIYSKDDIVSSLGQSDDPRSPKIMLQRGPNNPLIPLYELNDQEENVFGTSFVGSAGFLTRLASGAPITSYIKKKDLPKTADIEIQNGVGKIVNIKEADTFYIRVRACSFESSSSLFELTGKLPTPIWGISISQINNTKTGVLIPVKTSEYSPASAPITVKFPNELSLNYNQALRMAIAVVILSRVDISEQPSDNRGDPYFAKNTYKQGAATGLESTGRALFQKYSIGTSIYDTGDAVSFRGKVLSIAQNIQRQLNRISQPPKGVLEAIEEDINVVLKEKIMLPGSGTKMTILELLQSKDATQGIGPNPFVRGINKSISKRQYHRDYKKGPTRAPAFAAKKFSTGRWVFGEGSCDKAPILYNNPEPNFKTEFFRNEMLDASENIRLSCARILQIATIEKNAKEKGWTAIRLMPQALPEAEEILEQVEAFLLGILEALKGIADKIVALINAIQARIYQLQALLVQIKSLLESLLDFGLPAMAGVVMVEQGTFGIASGLIGTENKPVSQPTDYSAGVVVLAGGLPGLLIDILASIFEGGE